MFSGEIFATRLNSLMKANSVTQQALATAIGTSRPAVTQFANGSNLPSIEKLVAIAKYLDVSTDYLLGLTDNPQRA